MKLTQAKVKELRALAAKATAGPWECISKPGTPENCECVVQTYEPGIGHQLFDTLNRGYKESLIEQDPESGKWYDIRGQADLEFAAQARTALPDALEDLDGVYEMLERVHEHCEICNLNGHEPCELAEALRKWREG
jgi:hypothetical protein